MIGPFGPWSAPENGVVSPPVVAFAGATIGAVAVLPQVSPPVEAGAVEEAAAPDVAPPHVRPPVEAGAAAGVGATGAPPPHVRPPPDGEGAVAGAGVAPGISIDCSGRSDSPSCRYWYRGRALFPSG